MGAAYIIEEKAPGVRLGTLWQQWPRDSKLKVITQIVEMEKSLSSTSFTMHGCIYFKQDLQKLTGDAADFSTTPSISQKVLARYSIGPLTNPQLWKNGRTDMNLERGPCMSSDRFHARY